MNENSNLLINYQAKSGQMLTVPLYQTAQYQNYNFVIKAHKLSRYNEKDTIALKTAVKKIKKLYAHPVFYTYLQQHKEKLNIKTAVRVLYSRVRSIPKLINFVYDRNKGAGNMHALMGQARITTGPKINFRSHLKAGMLGHEIGHLFGYGHGSNVPKYMAAFIQSNFRKANKDYFAYKVYNLSKIFAPSTD